MQAYNKSFSKLLKGCFINSTVHRRFFSNQPIIVHHTPIPENANKPVLSQDQLQRMRLLRESDPVIYTPKRLSEMFNINRNTVAKLTKAPTHKRNELIKAEQSVTKEVQQEKKTRLENWIKKNQQREHKVYFSRKVKGMSGHILRDYRIALQRRSRDVRIARKQKYGKELSKNPPRGPEAYTIPATRAKKLANMDVPPTIVQGF